MGISSAGGVVLGYGVDNNRLTGFSRLIRAPSAVKQLHKAQSFAVAAEHF
jgi:hypothetical protein